MSDINSKNRQKLGLLNLKMHLAKMIHAENNCWLREGNKLIWCGMPTCFHIYYIRRLKLKVRTASHRMTLVSKAVVPEILARGMHIHGYLS